MSLLLNILLDPIKSAIATITSSASFTILDIVQTTTTNDTVNIVSTAMKHISFATAMVAFIFTTIAFVQKQIDRYNRNKLNNVFKDDDDSYLDNKSIGKAKRKITKHKPK